MQNCKISHDLNPPVESKLSRDILDSIGRFKSRDILHSEFESCKQPGLAWQANQTVVHYKLVQLLAPAQLLPVPVSQIS